MSPVRGRYSVMYGEGTSPTTAVRDMIRHMDQRVPEMSARFLSGPTVVRVRKAEWVAMQAFMQMDVEEDDGVRTED